MWPPGPVRGTLLSPCQNRPAPCRVPARTAVPATSLSAVRTVRISDHIGHKVFPYFTPIFRHLSPSFDIFDSVNLLPGCVAGLRFFGRKPPSRSSLVRYGDSQHSVRRHRRTAWEVALGTAPYPGEDKQVEEVHATEN